MTLFKPVIDVSHRPYCGPTAIGALTGVPIARIEKMLRRRRSIVRAKHWASRPDNSRRKMPIKGTYTGEVVRVLKGLGCKVSELKNPESTFGRFCRDTAHINASFLVEVTGHFMATYKGTFCDTSHHEPVPIEGYAKAARRVKRVWRVEAPAVPRFTVDDPIAPPPRPAKPKPDIKTVRAARVAARIKAWRTKRKRAETALRKLRRQAKHYGLTIVATPDGWTVRLP